MQAKLRSPGLGSHPNLLAFSRRQRKLSRARGTCCCWGWSREKKKLLVIVGGSVKSTLFSSCNSCCGSAGGTLTRPVFLHDTHHINMHKEKVFGLGQLEVSTGDRQEGQGTHGEGKCVGTWPAAEPGPSQGLPGTGED